MEKINGNPKPFLKWAGGKRRLLPEILKLLPAKFNRYFEPFLGGGALFFALHPYNAFLSDVNPELINTYIQVRDNTNKVIAQLKKMEFTKKFYYQMRLNKPKSLTSRAARFIYLNRTCWNGLYRENAKGEFNVPIGCYKNPMICDEKSLMEAKEALKNTTITHRDFEEILSIAADGDLVYLDPPYVTGHRNNGFINYNNKIFKWDDQCRLSKMATSLKKKGCYVIISNADHASIEALYGDFRSFKVSRLSLLAAEHKRRGLVEERILTSF